MNVCLGLYLALINKPNLQTPVFSFKKKRKEKNVRMVIYMRLCALLTCINMKKNGERKRLLRARGIMHCVQSNLKVKQKKRKKKQGEKEKPISMQTHRSFLFHVSHSVFDIQKNIHVCHWYGEHIGKIQTDPFSKGKGMLHASEFEHARMRILFLHGKREIQKDDH